MTRSALVRSILVLLLALVTIPPLFAQAPPAAPAAPAQLQFLEGHKGQVYDVVFGPDGASFASAGVDGAVRLWDRASGKPLVTLGQQPGAALSLAVSRDGLQLAAGGLDRTVRLFDMPRATPLADLPGVPNVPSALAISPDGKSVVSGDVGNTVRFWDLAPPKVVRDYAGMSAAPIGVGYVGNQIVAAAVDGTLRGWQRDTAEAVGLVVTPPHAALAVGPKGLLASAGQDGAARLIEWPPVAPLALGGHSDAVTAVCISADGKFMLTGGNDQLVHLFGADGKALRALVGQSGKVTAATLNADASLAATGSDTGLVKFWLAADGADRGALLAHTGAVTSVSFHPTAPIAATSGVDGLVRLWNLPTAARAPLPAHGAPVVAIATSGDGKLALSASADKTARLITLAGKAPPVALEPFAQPLTTAALNADGSQSALGDGAGLVRIQATAPAAVGTSFNAHEAAITGLAFPAGGKQLVSSAADGLVKVWRLPISPGKKLTLGAEPTPAVAFTADGKTAICGAADGSVRVVDVASGKEQRQIVTPVGAVTALAFAKDDATLLVGGATGSVALVSLAKDAAAPTMVVGHAGPVHAIVANPKRAEFASAGQDAAIRIWTIAADTKLPATERTITGHEGAVLSLAYAVDGATLLSGGADKSIRQWTIADGKQARALAGHADAVTGLAITADGAKLLSASADKTIKTWTMADGANSATITLATPVRTLSLSGDGKRCATGGDDMLARVWDLASGKTLQHFAGHQGPIGRVAMSADGNAVLSVGADKAAQLWTVDAQLVIVADAMKVFDLALVPGGEQFVTAGADKLVKLWDLTGKLVRPFAGSQTPVTSVAVRADGAQIAAGGDPTFAQPTVFLWNTKDAVALPPIITPAGVGQMAYNADGYLAVCGADKHLRVYSTTSPQLAQDFVLPAVLGDVAFADSRALLGAGGDNNTFVLDFALRQLLAGQGAVSGVAFVAGGDSVVTAGADRTVRLWSLKDGKPTRNYGGNPGPVVNLSASADGKTIAAVGSDQTVRVWPVEPKAGAAAAAEIAPQATIKLAAAIRAASLSADGSRLAVASDDNFARLYDAASGLEFERFVGHANPALAVALAGDGKTLITGSADKTARRWRSSVVAAIVAHQPAASDVAFSTDGGTLYTAGADKAIVSWSIGAKGLKELKRYLGAEKAIKSISVSGDGKLLAAGGDDLRIMLWDIETAKPVASIVTTAAINAVVLDATGAKLIAGGADKLVRTFALETLDGKLTATLLSQGAAHSEPINRLVLGADNSTAVSASGDKTLKRWFAASAGVRKEIKGHTGPIYSLAFSGDGKLLASASADKTARLWNTESGAAVATCEGHTRQVNGVAFEPKESKQLATCSLDGALKLWDLEGKNLGELKDAASLGLNSVAYAPNGAALFAGGASRICQRWSLPNQKPLPAIAGHNQPIYQISPSPSGLRLATLDFVGQLQIVDPATGAVLFRQQLSVAAATHFAYSPDGKELLVATTDPRVIKLLIPGHAQ